MWPIIFSNFLPSFILAVLLTPLVHWCAMKNGWIARPKADRWHQKPTALMGGIAIFAAIAVPSLRLFDFRLFSGLVLKNNNAQSLPSLSAVVFIGACFLFTIGLVDDLKNIKPHSKLIGQILAASLVTFLGFRLHWFESLTLDTMATLFWIVGITNAFNLIDNMDGLCAGIGLVASVNLAVLYHGTSSEGFHIALIFAGASAGFLIYNFNPAKIFMGDCGSLVIGFSISVLSLFFAETNPKNTLATVAVPIFVVLVPILDTTLVTVIRLLSGRKASTGGRDHTSHRLVLMGFSEKKAVLMLYLIGAISGLAAIYVSVSDTLTSPAVIIPVGLAILLMGVYLSQLRVYPEKEFSLLRNRSFTPILIELTYKRQLVLVTLDFFLVAFAYYLSYRLRFEDSTLTYYFKIFLKSLPMIISCKLIVFFIMGIYRGLWGFISTSDVALYMRASLVGSLVSVVALTFIYRFKDFSKGIFVIDYILTLGLLLGVRGSFRMFMETQNRRTLEGDKVIIYGAGRGGELLLREILHNKSRHVIPVGFIDDDTLKKGKIIQGLNILGTFKEIDQIQAKCKVGTILISFNGLHGRHATAYEATKTYCRQQGLKLKQFKVDLQEVDLNQD